MGLRRPSRESLISSSKALLGAIQTRMDRARWRGQNSKVTIKIFIHGIEYKAETLEVETLDEASRLWGDLLDRIRKWRRE